MHNEKEGMPVTALREIKILKALKHPCIVEILDMFVVRSKYRYLHDRGLLTLWLVGTAKDPLSVYMVFPYMDHDLAGLLENDRVKLQPSQIKLYMKQLLEGTEYMHRVSCVMFDPIISWGNRIPESYPPSRHEGCQPAHIEQRLSSNCRFRSCADF